MININGKDWEKIRFSDIEKFLRGTDDERIFFEFKSDDESTSKLAKEISAFANTYGGYIFLGINNDKSIGGCKKWTEQRIHTSVHDSIIPTPNFDVKKFKNGNDTIFIIKIEEGIQPPYITNKGEIFERVSSGSFPVRDSGKLSQLYYKNKDNNEKIKRKIELDKIDLSSTRPNNLCGYLDLGFSVVSSNVRALQKKFFECDLLLVSEFLKSQVTSYSISKMGRSYQISIGDLFIKSIDNEKSLASVGINNFFEIMCDGSVRSRILFTYNEKDNKADISLMGYFFNIMKEVYKIIFGDKYSQLFVSAHKYEELTVLKQFIPYYNFVDDDNYSKFFNDLLVEHQRKYGNNLIIESNRIPKNDYMIVDKRGFNASKLKYNTDNLLQQLFLSQHFNLGYIDFPQFF